MRILLICSVWPLGTIKFYDNPGNIFPQMLMKVPPMCNALGLEEERDKSRNC